MDIFDQYLLKELITEYERPNLTDDDYEELYARFCNLKHLQEAQTYILVMRFLGLGTPSNENAVLNELKGIMAEQVELTGLYYDLKLCANPQDAEAAVELLHSIDDGYCGKFLGVRSNIDLVESSVEVDELTSDPVENYTEVDDSIHFKSMNFEGCGYSGLYFTSGDIDYLNAKVFIEPMKADRDVVIRSQIFVGEEPFSKVFTDEFTLKAGDCWFTTTGWGNKNFNCYGNRTYQWRLEIDGADVYCQDFRFYSGKIDKRGMPIKDIKLFASKASGAVEGDRCRHATSFDADKLEYVYLNFFFDPLGAERNIQVFIKIDCLEDGTEFYNGYSLFRMESNWDNAWTGIGPKTGGKWKCGLYKYTLIIGSSTYEGTFTVY